MLVNRIKYSEIDRKLKEKGILLVAVSKTKPVEAIRELYDLGQRDFGENYVQELVDKQAQLPADIRWHFIGHLQSNKVKYIAPFVYLIHGIDSAKLLKEVDKQALKNNRVIDVLLQIHIASEETKFGLDAEELDKLLDPVQMIQMKNVRIRGLMGMASFTSNKEIVRNEFSYLKQLYDKYAGIVNGLNSQPYTNESFTILSMGMSGDFELAIEEGSTLVRIGSLIFGERSNSSS